MCVCEVRLYKGNENAKKGMAMWGGEGRKRKPGVIE